MSLQERQAEDLEMMQLTHAFNALMETMDPMQRQILQSNMSQMMPSGQIAFMKKLVADGGADVLPPSQEEIKEWKAVYLSYFNANLSVKKGRVLPLEYCVRNPRPDELMEAFRTLQIRAIFEAVSFQSIPQNQLI